MKTRPSYEQGRNRPAGVPNSRHNPIPFGVCRVPAADQRAAPPRSTRAGQTVRLPRRSGAFTPNHPARRFLPGMPGTCAAGAAFGRTGGVFFLKFSRCDQLAGDAARDGSQPLKAFRSVGIHAQQCAWRSRQCSVPQRAEKFGQSA